MLKVAPSSIQPLQLLQNGAPETAFNLPTFCHTTSFLQSLYWLPLAAASSLIHLCLASKSLITCNFVPCPIQASRAI